MVCFCPTRQYPPGDQSKAVDMRARLLPAQYRSVAKRQFVRTPEDQMGPVERKLALCGELQGLVVGAFGEVSEHLYSLVEVFASARLATMGLDRGRLGSDGELGQIRRKLSVTFVRAQTECSLARLPHLGVGAM